jgi:hypothetical protein
MATSAERWEGKGKKRREKEKQRGKTANFKDAKPMNG